MALFIIFTTYTRNGFKKFQCERTFILCKASLVLKKIQVFTRWKYSERNNRIDYIDNSNSLIKCLFNFHKVFSNSDRKRCVQTGDLRDFIKFTGKHLCQSLFFNKFAALRPATLLKKRLWHRCFHVNFAKCLRTLFATEHLQWLLLYVVEEKL